MASQVVLEAIGLNVQPNSLSLPNGSLVEAKNIIIRRDNVMESRRGFKLDGDTFGSSNDRLKQLLTYKNRILRHFNSTLQFEDGSNNDGTRAFSDFAGSYLDAKAGTRLKSIEANGNLYFTSGGGIKKLSAKTGSDLSTAAGTITQAGGVKAIDIQAYLNIVSGNQTGFLPGDAAVAYRVAWSINDKNDNLIIGAPSQRTEVYNGLNSLLLRDLSSTLGALDDIDQTGSMIDDGNYVETLLLGPNATASEVKTAVVNLATKLDADILYAAPTGAPLVVTTAVISSGILTITFTGTVTDYFSVGSKIFLTGFSPVTGTIDGQQTVVSVTSTTITLNTTATGVVTLTSPRIESAEYRNIVSTPGTTYQTPLTTLVISGLPTDDDLKTIQENIERIQTRLRAEPIAVVSLALSNEYLVPLDVTTTATVTLEINIPEEITENHFLQVYRSSIAQATGTTVLTDLVPNDEMQLIYEAYPTAAELAAKSMVFEDITPDAFRGAYLYTNEATGEGALQANDIPPFAVDINSFKNSVFYANTKTRHKKTMALLGVSQMITDYENGITPKITIASGSVSNTYSFVTGQQQVSQITAVADVSDSLNGTYFLVSSAEDVTEYYVWFKTSGGVETDPAVVDRTGIKVLIDTNSTAATVASKVVYTVGRYIQDFIVGSPSSTVIEIVNSDIGPSTPISAGTSGFTGATTTQTGRGEDATGRQILLSTAVSPAIAVDETAKSLIRVLNQNADETVYGYYISGANTVPGRMLLEARELSDDPFYLLGNNDNTGLSFNPDIGPLITLSSITAGNSANNLITTSAPHGLTDGAKIVLSDTDCVPSVDGLHSIKYVSATSFRLALTITTGSTLTPAGVGIRAVDSEASANEVAPNRIYYSKANQPEAVPIVNYFDVGASDKEILRIFPLRDSLFVFKEDGLFRVSGEGVPFTQALFDSSYIMISADSLALTGSNLYAWTTQGISSVSEAGTSPAVSRPIDVNILRLATPAYTNFESATFGVGYESDNCYMVWTVTDKTDVHATTCYRLSTLTNTWTTFSLSNTCGVINPTDDRLYLGSADVNSMEQERKTFDRYDYSDREISFQLTGGNYFGKSLKFSSVDNILPGDVMVQTQKLTVYIFNNMLMRLDTDPGVADSNYLSLLEAKSGDNLRLKLLALATKLDADVGTSTTGYLAAISAKTGSITGNTIANPTIVTTAAPHGLINGREIQIINSNSTPSIDGKFTAVVTGPSTLSIPVDVKLEGTTGTFLTLDNSFSDLNSSYNILVNLLNNDVGVTFSNYSDLDVETAQEAIVVSVNKITKQVTLNLDLEWIVGEVILFKAIDCAVTYAPQTMGDPLGYKQVREATIMFENKAFTKAVVAFSTDLLPLLVEVPFNGDGNGIFGHSKMGTGFFGGNSNSAPLRTYIPRNCQRCRYINVRFNHKTAREQWAIFGMTLTGEISQSSRAYNK